MTCLESHRHGTVLARYVQVSLRMHSTELGTCSYVLAWNKRTRTSIESSESLHGACSLLVDRRFYLLQYIPSLIPPVHN